MVRVKAIWQRLTCHCATKQIHHVAALRTAGGDRVDAELRPRVGLFDLPGAGSTENDREPVLLARLTDRLEHPPGVECIDRLP